MYLDLALSIVILLIIKFSFITRAQSYLSTFMSLIITDSYQVQNLFVYIHVMNEAVFFSNCAKNIYILLLSYFISTCCCGLCQNLKF